MKKLLCVLLLLTSCGGDSGKIPIAIVSPVVHPSIRQIENGVRDSLDPEKYDVVIYNAQGSQSLLRSEVEEIHRKGFALVVTIGKSPSHMAAEVFAKKGSETPIVFTAVHGAGGLSGRYVTGIEEVMRIEEEMEAFLTELPHLSHLLLVYNPEHSGAKEQKRTLQEILERKEIQLSAVEVFHTNEIKAKATPALEGVDAVLIFRDNTVVSGLDALVKLCRERAVPILTSETDSPDRGATFGFGPNERDFGVEAAQKARLILEEGRDPGSIPVTSVSHHYLKRGSDVSIHP
ncbi:MAG: ABC transporter substrate-binding protein [Parachlamydiaceae bacterium]